MPIFSIDTTDPLQATTTTEPIPPIMPGTTTTTTDPIFSNCGMSVYVYSLDSNTLCFDITGGTAPYDFYVDDVIIGTSNTDGVHCFTVDCTITHTFNVTDSTPPCTVNLNEYILNNTGFTGTTDWVINNGGGDAFISGDSFIFTSTTYNTYLSPSAIQNYVLPGNVVPISVSYYYEFNTGDISNRNYDNIYLVTPFNGTTSFCLGTCAFPGLVSNTFYSGNTTVVTFPQVYPSTPLSGYGFSLGVSLLEFNNFELLDFNLQIVSYTYDCACTVTGNTQIYLTTTTTCYFNAQTYWSGDSICFDIVGGVAPYEIYIDSVLVDTVNTSGVHCYTADYTVTHTYEVSDSTPPCTVVLNQDILNNTGFTSNSDWIINGGGANAFISGGSFIITATTYNTLLSSSAIQDYVLPNNVIPISVDYYWEFNSGDISNRNYNQLVLVTPFNGNNSVYLEGGFPGVVPNTFYSGNTTVNTFPQVYPPTPLSGYGFAIYSSLLQDNYFELKDFRLEIVSYTYDCTCTITGVTEIPCYCYLIENQNGSNSDYSAYDCNGVYYTGTVLSAQFISICGNNVQTLPGSPPLNITVNGQCDGNLSCIPNCYIVFNSGFTGCEVIYVDYSGNTQIYLLPPGELFQVCSLVEPAATGILCARTLVTTQTGICSGDTCPTACNCYFIENPSETTDVDFIALDCNGDFYSGTVLAGQFVTLCGSNVQSTSLPLNITVNGLCDISGNCVANCWLVYNTGQTNCQFYYIDYSSNIQIEVISPSLNGTQICSLVQPEGIGRICSQNVYSVLIGDCIQDTCSFPTTTTTTQPITTTTTLLRECKYRYMDCNGNTFTGTVIEGEIIYVCSSGTPEMIECFLNINYLGSCENTPNCIVTTTTTLEPACYCYLIGISSTTSSTTSPPNSTTTSSTAGNSTTTSSTAGNSTTTSSTAGNSTTTSTAPTTTIPPAACSDCKYVDVFISLSDLTDANNYATVVEFQYYDCNANFQTEYYGWEFSGLTDVVCVCLDTTTKLVYYDSGFTEYVASNSTATPTQSGCTQALMFTSSPNSCVYTGTDCNGISFSGTITSGEQIYVCSRTEPQSTECTLEIIDKGLCGGIDCGVTTTTSTEQITTTTSTEQVTTTTSSEILSTTTTIPCICYTIDYDLGNSICAIEYINCSGNTVIEDIGILSSSGQTSVCSQNEPVYSCSIEDGFGFINIISTGTYCVNGQCVLTTTSTSSDVTTTSTSSDVTTTSTSSDVTTTSTSSDVTTTSTSSDVTTTTSSNTITTTTSNEILCDCIYVRNDDISPCSIEYIPCSGGTPQFVSIGIGQTINLCVQSYTPPIDCVFYIRNVGSCTSECGLPQLACYTFENVTQNDCTVDYINGSNNLITTVIPGGGSVSLTCVTAPISSDCIIGSEVIVTLDAACSGGQCIQP